MCQIKSIFRKFDLFSTQFMFQVGDGKSKQTFIGGLISFLFLAVGVLYLYYMLYLYFNNQVQPNIYITKEVITEKIIVPLEKEQIFFQFSVKGQGLLDYQKEVNKTYFDLVTYYEYYNPIDGIRHSYQKELLPCEDPKLQQYFCIGTKNLNHLMVNPITTEGITFSIRIEPCDPQKYNNCATQEELENFNTYENYLAIYSKITQYNPKNQKYEDQLYFDYLYLDINTYIYSRLVLSKGETQIISGALFQESEYRTTIYDYTKGESFMKYQGTQKRMGMNAYIYVSIEPHQQIVYITIQYPMITVVLAQFMSIFNCLVITGFFLRYLAYSYIYDDLSIVLLKNYYKKTAMQLIEKEERLKTFQNSESAKQSLEEVQTQIDLVDFKKQGGNIFRGSCKRRIKSVLATILGKAIIKNSDDKQTVENQIYCKLTNKTLKSLDIYQLQTEIIRLKMAIKLIFTKEQYAAFFYCGSELMQQDQVKLEQEPFQIPQLQVIQVDQDINLNENIINQKENKSQLQQISGLNFKQNQGSETELENQYFKEQNSFQKANSQYILKKELTKKSKNSNYIDSLQETKNQLGETSLNFQSNSNLSNKFSIDNSFQNNFKGGMYSPHKIQGQVIKQSYKFDTHEGDLDPSPPFDDCSGREQQINNDESEVKVRKEQEDEIHFESQIDKCKNRTKEQKINRCADDQNKECQFQQKNSQLKVKFDNSVYQEKESGYKINKNNNNNIEIQNIQRNQQELSLNNSNDEMVHKLKEMDAIEEQKQIRLIYLKLFLSKMRQNSKNRKHNYLDQIIFQNLVFDQKDVTIQRNVEDDEILLKCQSLKKLTINPYIQKDTIKKTNITPPHQ